ncbi:MAG: carboxypeptidase-like regulatory domain-containing protein [Prevotella sp.]|nr:carboxypeptidase-like regulatory domain-containing protein [Prevotella sp.]
MNVRLLLLLLALVCSASRMRADDDAARTVVTGVTHRGPQPPQDTTRWYNRVQHLSELTVTTSQKRYSRKNNPAVELMRRVIAAKRRTDLAARDYYSYDKYQKLTMATNDISMRDLSEGILSRIPNVYRYIELCPYNRKLILPMMMTETVTHKVYRREPHAEQETVTGERSDGINTIFRSGDVLVAALKDFFTDVDIYDEQIRLLQHPFTSPISHDAIDFYRFYIIDTLDVGRDRCIHLSFLPNNRQDFGFSGDIYVMTDGSWRVRRCELTLPKQTGVNFVDDISIMQEFAPLPDGQWALVADDMVVEMSLFDFLQKAVVIRNTRITGHDFSPVADSEFSIQAHAATEREAKKQSETFWTENRRVDLTRGEEDMDRLMAGVDEMGRSNVLMKLIRLLIENYVETGGRNKDNNKVDIGPILSVISANSVDGLRTRIGGQTTALLNPRLFFNGYYAHGWKSRQEYYKAELTYSFRDNEYLADEFPRRSISFMSTRDIGYPADRFLSTDKDNLFTALKWTDTGGMVRYNRQQLKAVREEEWGLRSTLSLTAEDNEACGGLRFVTLADRVGAAAGDVTALTSRHIRTTEIRGELRYAPGEKFVSTRRGRRLINLDAPVLTLSHATGLSGMMGGRYRYNLTEASFFKRVWVKSWGKVDISLAAGAQWNRVPFPLLIVPASNLSYVIQKDMFNLMSNMEFLNDRYASAHLSWDLNGKLFNRLPLIRQLKWREYIGVKMLWGDLTDKNNPMLPQNAGNAVLMTFPAGSHVMDPNRPYVEALVGVHNVFRFLHIEYVRRLTYLDLPTASKHGVRFKFSMKF